MSGRSVIFTALKESCSCNVLVGVASLKLLVWNAKAEHIWQKLDTHEGKSNMYVAKVQYICQRTWQKFNKYDKNKVDENKATFFLFIYLFIYIFFLGGGLIYSFSFDAPFPVLQYIFFAVLIF